MGSHLWLPRERDGRSVAYVEGNGFGELIDEAADCLRAHLVEASGKPADATGYR